MGFRFLELLGIIFIILKLTGNIMWSWWYVTMPLWGPWAVIIVLAFIVAICNDLNSR